EESTRRHMLDLYLYVTSANFTIVGRALVRASKPKIMQDAIETTTKLMNKKINTPVECQTKNKKRSSTNANTTNIQKGTGASQKATCYECGNQRHYRRDCLERKNQNHENQIKSTKARGVVHAFGGGETEQDLNNIEDEIEA
nr:hypothetical protein [Tanacetum cinerariifolium]